MKKILLGTTVLVGAAALFAGAASAAETPKVTIGGYADFQVGHVSEDADAGLRSGSFRNESEINVNIDAKTDAGLGYGALINLETSTTDDGDNEQSQAPRGYIYVEGAWGRIQGGSDLGVTSTMKVDASSIARATGGIDGDFNYFLTSTGGGRVIATPDLLLDYGFDGGVAFGDESSESNNKLSYYTPRFAGFQAGVSYIFSSAANDRGISVNRADNTAGEAESIFALGLNYEGKFDAITFGASATGEIGDGETAATEDLRSWALGAKAGFMGFTLAGSYGNWGDSLAVVTDADDSDYWTAGLSYEFGPFGASVTYLNSTYDLGATENEFDNLSIGVDYKLAPGLTPYAEVSFVDVDKAGTVNDNDGTVFIAGTQLAF